MMVELKDPRPTSPETSIDRAFSYGLDVWARVREDEFDARRPSTRKLIEGNVSRRLDPEERRGDIVQHIVEGSRFVSETDERVELLNSFLMEICFKPEVSLAELREMGYGLDSEANGDETIYSVARFLTQDL